MEHFSNSFQGQHIQQHQSPLSLASFWKNLLGQRWSIFILFPLGIVVVTTYWFLLVVCIFIKTLYRCFWILIDFSSFFNVNGAIRLWWGCIECHWLLTWSIVFLNMSLQKEIVFTPKNYGRIPRLGIVTMISLNRGGIRCYQFPLWWRKNIV